MDNAISSAFSGLMTAAFWITIIVSMFVRAAKKRQKAEEERRRRGGVSLENQPVHPAPQASRTLRVDNTRSLSSGTRVRQSQGLRATAMRTRSATSMTAGLNSMFDAANQWLAAVESDNNVSKPDRIAPITAPAEEALDTLHGKGSMDYDSPEGVEYHPEHQRTLITPEPPAASVVPGLDLPMDRGSIIGYMMFSEILAKPVSLRRRAVRA